jgi:hypothetical protein
MRSSYERGDFPGGLVRGRYHKPSLPAGTIAVIAPELREAFPNSEAVNAALRAAQASTATK